MTRLAAPSYLEIHVPGYGTFRVPPFSGDAAHVEFLAEQRLQDQMAARFNHPYTPEPMEYAVTGEHVIKAQFGFEAIIKTNKETAQ